MRIPTNWNEISIGQFQHINAAIKNGLILINLIIFIFLLRKKKAIPLPPLIVLFILCLGASWLYLIYKPYRYMGSGGDIHLVDYPRKYFFFYPGRWLFCINGWQCNSKENMVAGRPDSNYNFLYCSAGDVLLPVQ
jgi:hypothetical protein